MKRVFLATSNPGKIRDFRGTAMRRAIEILSIPGLSALPTVIEDGETFAANARKKAESYSRYVQDELVIADDSGLEVEALAGAPGVHSARYAQSQPSSSAANSDDANNRKLISELKHVGIDKRRARFVCVIAAARNGHTLEEFEGQVQGLILGQPRGTGGFGYDPLFYFPPLEKTFAELGPEEKARYSHRGQAFRKFLDWFEQV